MIAAMMNATTRGPNRVVESHSNPATPIPTAAIWRPDIPETTDAGVADDGDDVPVPVRRSIIMRLSLVASRTTLGKC
jgi:hypothetical protein